MEALIFSSFSPHHLLLFFISLLFIVVFVSVRSLLDYSLNMRTRSATKRASSDAQASDPSTKREKASHDSSKATAISHTNRPAKPAQSRAKRPVAPKSKHKKKSTNGPSNQVTDPSPASPTATNDSRPWFVGERDPDRMFDASGKWTWDKTKPLEEQIPVLERRVRVLEGHLERCTTWRCFLEGSWAPRISPEYHPGNFHKVFVSISNYTGMWARGVAFKGGLPDLSAEQKKDIVTSLDGYLASDDLEYIQSRLDPVWQGRFPEFLLRMFVNKFFVENMFNNPFWDINENAGRDDESKWEVWTGATPAGELLNTLHTRFQEDQPEGARIWRTLTVRLCNWTEDSKMLSEFVEAQNTHRETMCTALAKHLLAHKVVQSLMRPSRGTPEDRVEWTKMMMLEPLFEYVTEMHKWVPVLKFRTLKDLDPGLVSADGETMQYYRYTGETPHKRLEVLAIVEPNVYRTFDTNESDERKIHVQAAMALVAKADPPLDAEGVAT
ncbi:hypothetical protein BJY04DRAFT_223001 [Aspergillus karnatakaensis]|uniref:uncharacterized protein n=1 Tax=Aspergillus karnatakaensis TaxID=1810916 RepID=UPI003CCDDFD3